MVTRRLNNNRQRVYQVLYDIGVKYPGMLVINCRDISDKQLERLEKQNKIYRNDRRTELDFGFTEHTYRFAGITDQYLMIDDLVSQMIVMSLETVQKGISIKDYQAHPDLLKAVDQTKCYLPEGFIPTTEINKMFATGGNICYYNKELTNIGRLGNILKAGDFTLTSDSSELEL